MLLILSSHSECLHIEDDDLRNRKRNRNCVHLVWKWSKSIQLWVIVVLNQSLGVPVLTSHNNRVNPAIIGGGTQMKETLGFYGN